jgi:hypothetical protein
MRDVSQPTRERGSTTHQTLGGSTCFDAGGDQWVTSNQTLDLRRWA